jgi:hypothetical protein
MSTRDLEFWLRIRGEVFDSLIASDQRLLDELCSSKTWNDCIPLGLRSSYHYIFEVTQGLSTHESHVVERDVLRTIGGVKLGDSVFDVDDDCDNHDEKSSYARSMKRLLISISLTDNMGYCQGMNYAADFLLRRIPEKDAFCLFLYTLRNKHLCCLYETKLPFLSDFMEIFSKQLEFNLPDLTRHLNEMCFFSPFYSIEWFTTAFSLACPPELTFAVWDMFLFNGKDVFLKCAVAIMCILEKQLMLLNGEELLKNFRYFLFFVP